MRPAIVGGPYTTEDADDDEEDEEDTAALVLELTEARDEKTAGADDDKDDDNEDEDEDEDEKAEHEINEYEATVEIASCVERGVTAEEEEAMRETAGAGICARASARDRAGTGSVVDEGEEEAKEEDIDKEEDEEDDEDDVDDVLTTATEHDVDAEDDRCGEEADADGEAAVVADARVCVCTVAAAVAMVRATCIARSSSGEAGRAFASSLKRASMRSRRLG